MSSYSSGYPDNSQRPQNFHFAEDTDERFARGDYLGWRLLLLVIFTISLLLADQFTRSKPLTAQNPSISTLQYGANLARSSLKFIVTPFELTASAPTELGLWLDDLTTSRSTLQAHNDALTDETLLLNVKLQQLASLEAENTRLRALLNASSKRSEDVLIAEIVATADDPFRQQIQINKGLRDNLYIGQPLIDSDGVIGQITRVDPFTSWVILISDSDHAIPVEIRRNGLRTVARGTGETDRLLLPFLPIDADILPGDELWTSGLGGIFPPGYKVGMVSQVGRDISGKYAQIEAVPAAALDRQRQLLLLMPQAAAEDSELSRPNSDPITDANPAVVPESDLPDPASPGGTLPTPP